MTKAELEEEQDKIVKLLTYDLSLFISQSYDGSQNFLIFQPIFNTYAMAAGLHKCRNENLKSFQTKKLNLLLRRIIVFLQNLYG